MMGKKVILALAIGVILGVTGIYVCAEEARVDMSERLNDAVLEYGKTRYRQRKRLTTLLFLGVASGAPGDEDETVEFLMMIAVDDARKRITPIRLDPGVADGSEAGENSAVLPSEEEDAEKLRCERVLSAVNALLPETLAEYYLALDEEGLCVLDGQTADSAGFEERARAIARQMEQVSTREASALLSDLSDYICTNMKSGALMNVVDKADRYEIADALDMAGLAPQQTEGGAASDADETEWMEAIIDVFYEESPW